MTNYKARKANIHVETYHNQAGTTTTKTFTHNIDLKNKYSKIILEVASTPTAAANTYITLNSLTSGYYNGMLSQTATTLAGSDPSSNTSQWQVTDVLTAATNMYGIQTIEISFNESYGAYRIVYTSSGNQRIAMGSGYQSAQSDGQITSVTIAISTSSWKQDFKCSMYKVKRT